MSVVKINAIDVPEGRGPQLEERFAARVSEVEKMPGFEHFELLRPVQGESRYFVYTRWETEEHFRAWVESEGFRLGHAKAREADQGGKPTATGASLLAFEVVTSASAGA